MSVMVEEVSILHQSVAKHEADFEAVRQGRGKEERIRRTVYFQIFFVIFFLFYFVITGGYFGSCIIRTCLI